MAQLRIDDVVESKSGKAWRVKSGNVWYNAFKDSGIEKLKGRTIEAEIETSDKWGAGIKGFKLIESSPSVETPRGIPPMAPTIAPFWMPFASNVVAHAISAGVIKEPTDLKQWVFAAKGAAEAAAKDDVEF